MSYFSKCLRILQYNIFSGILKLCRNRMIRRTVIQKILSEANELREYGAWGIANV